MTLWGMVFGINSREIKTKYRDRKVTKIVIKVDRAGTTHNHTMSRTRQLVYHVKIHETQRTDRKPSIFSDIYRWDTHFRFLDSTAENYAGQVARYIQRSGIEVEAFGPKYKTRERLM